MLNHHSETSLNFRKDALLYYSPFGMLFLKQKYKKKVDHKIVILFLSVDFCFG
jgi:hypothetical protein